MDFEPKVVGRGRNTDQGSPANYVRRAAKLQARCNKLNPFPKPRGFVFKAKTWEAYEKWKRSQTNPRLW